MGVAHAAVDVDVIQTFRDIYLSSGLVVARHFVLYELELVKRILFFTIGTVILIVKSWWFERFMTLVHALGSYCSHRAKNAPECWEFYRKE